MKELYALGVGHSTPLFIEIAEAAGWNIAGLYHYNDDRVGQIDHGYKILGSFEDMFRKDIDGMCFLLTMGDMAIRELLTKNIIERGGIVPSIIHPSAHISKFASISSQGVIIGDRVELQSDVNVEQNVILRSDVTVCHNTKIESNVFVGPKALLGAYISVREFAFIGQGAILVSGKVDSIGKNSLVGAGALVTKTVPDDVIVVGHPARIIKKRV